MSYLPGRWIGYYVDLAGELHELSDEETPPDADDVAFKEWNRLGSPSYRAMGITHVSAIEGLRLEHRSGPVVVHTSDPAEFYDRLRTRLDT